MHQDEAGRWVSDNGRYLWSGSEWIDLEQEPTAEADPMPVAARSAIDADADPDAGPGPTSEPATDAPGTRARTASAAATATASASASPRRSRNRRSRKRRPLLLLGLLVLVAVGVAAVLVVGNRSNSKPTSATPPPSAAATPGTQPSSPSDPTVLDEAQRRERAERALVSASDFPQSTEERQATPTDVFLPCRAAALTPPPGTVLVGRTVSNSDFTVYVGQTIAGYSTVRDASEALDRVRSALQQCAPYDYKYANSPRIDRISHTDVGTPLDVADGGVYLAEVDTPSNYSGTTTTYSYGYVRRGQFLVRLTLTNRSQADRDGLERLMRNVTDQLG